jgi:hypothetical protein
MCETPQRLYAIQDDFYHYRTGYLDDGNQVLLLSDDEGARVAESPWVEFDGEGDLITVHPGEVTPISKPALSFTPGTIRVKPFFLPDLWIGIRNLPDHYQKFLDNPADASEEERRYYPEKIRDWRESGSFVLWFNEDYYLSKDGEVESS